MNLCKPIIGVTAHAQRIGFLAELKILCAVTM
jgi:hypothetical protein